MPTYEFQCLKCEHQFELILSVGSKDAPQACPECADSEVSRLMSTMDFVLRGDNWPGKNLLVREQMAEKNARLSQKSREKFREAPGLKLVPNVGGDRVENWKEARKLAASRGKVSETYTPMVQTEDRS